MPRHASRNPTLVVVVGGHATQADHVTAERGVPGHPPRGSIGG
jgi:hypothetical protein